MLVDGIGTWITNLMLAEKNIDAGFEDVLSALENCNGHVVIVSDETGLGIVPDNAMARQFQGSYRHVQPTGGRRDSKSCRSCQSQPVNHSLSRMTVSA